MSRDNKINFIYDYCFHNAIICKIHLEIIPSINCSIGQYEYNLTKLMVLLSIFSDFYVILELFNTLILGSDKYTYKLI